MLAFFLLIVCAYLAKWAFILPFLEERVWLTVDLVLQSAVVVAFLLSWLNNPGYVS